jgi:hypothetical protein
MSRTLPLNPPDLDGMQGVRKLINDRKGKGESV